MTMHSRLAGNEACFQIFDCQPEGENKVQIRRFCQIRWIYTVFIDRRMLHIQRMHIPSNADSRGNMTVEPVACPARGCEGLLRRIWHRGKVQLQPCSVCCCEFKVCARKETCCGKSGAVQRTRAFHRNGKNLRPICKLCQKRELRYIRSFSRLCTVC